METTGKHESNKRIATHVIHHVIPTYMPDIERGLAALAQVHRNTNKLVMQEENCLSDVLTKKDTVRTYVLALYVELGEFIQTLNWKPWRSKPQEPKERILDEFADIIAFVGVLITILNALGYSPEDLTDAYRKKEYTNISRFLKESSDDTPNS